MTLSQADKERAFDLAMAHLHAWHGEKFKEGVDDRELKRLIMDSMGSGGTLARGLIVKWSGLELKIWACHAVPFPERPILSGEIIVRLARQRYRIPDHTAAQLELL